MGGHERWPEVLTAPGPQEIFRFLGRFDGPRLLVLGAIHGDEVCGANAIRVVLTEIARGEIEILRGGVTFVPECNPLAFANGTRRGTRDLNRNFGPVSEPRTYEDFAVNTLCDLMRESDILLDLHSFRATGDAFVFIGPHNNDGSLEPFSRAIEEEALSKSLGVERLVHGWLECYSLFVSQQNAFLDKLATSGARISERASPTFGVGTTEFFRTIGGCGVTLECGNHRDVSSQSVAHRAIMGAIGHLELSNIAPPTEQNFSEVFKFSQILIREHEEDSFTRPWQAFTRVRGGDELGRRHDGTAVRAPADGIIMFAYSDAKVGAEWIYFASNSQRFS